MKRYLFSLICLSVLFFPLSSFALSFESGMVTTVCYHQGTQTFPVPLSSGSNADYETCTYTSLGRLAVETSVDRSSLIYSWGDLAVIGPARDTVVFSTGGNYSTRIVDMAGGTCTSPDKICKFPIASDLADGLYFLGVQYYANPSSLVNVPFYVSDHLVYLSLSDLPSASFVGVTYQDFQQYALWFLFLVALIFGFGLVVIWFRRRDIFKSFSI